MFGLYIDTALDLSTVFYGIPFLLVSTLITVAFGMIVLYPLGKMMNTETYKRFPVFHVINDNSALRLTLGFPVSIIVFLTLGVNVLAVMNVIIKVYKIFM